MFRGARGTNLRARAYCNPTINPQLQGVLCNDWLGLRFNHQNMKYYVLQRGMSYDENTLHACDTETERNVITQKLIFGEAVSGIDEQSQWAKYAEELRESGSVSFEGDPGVEWFTAWPASCPNHRLGHTEK